MLLRSSPADLSGAIGAVAAAATIPIDHVEKDYWLTECMRGMAQYATDNGLTVLLKGGTSLSKAFSLLRRFSEDADMLVVFGEESTYARDRHLKGLVAACEQASALTAVSNAAVSRSGVKRVVTLDYPQANSGAVIRPHVLVELGTIGGAIPATTKQLRSLLSAHWDAAGLGAHDYDELAPFDTRVIEPCRTLVEKLVLLHEAHCRNNGTARSRQLKTVRHYYDVYCLMGDVQILADVGHHGIATMARDVETYSRAAGYAAAGRPPGGFAASPAFRQPPFRAISDAYDRTVAGLVWPGAVTPTLGDCVARIHQHAAVL